MQDSMSKCCCKFSWRLVFIGNEKFPEDIGKWILYIM